MNAAIVRAVRALERRIDLLDRRIEQLESQKESANKKAATSKDNAASFEAAVETLVRLHTERLNLRARKEVVWAFGKVIEATPARSGYARTGWTLTAGSSRPPVPRTIPTGEADEYHADRVEAAVQAALANLPEDALTPVFVGNAVPYMALLEAGLSDQAPAGFVAAAVENLRARLELLAHEDNP